MKPPGSDRFGSGPAGVALAYVGVSWVLIQVVESFDQLLDGLPDSLIRGALVLLVVGFPVVVTTAWVQQRRDRASVSASGALALFTWRNALFGGVGALALWGVVAAVWLMVGTPGIGPAAGSDGPRSLAVLPFQNLLPDGEDREWIVLGLHEQVIHELAGLPELHVTSRTSVLPYAGSDLSIPEIADSLGVDLVLEGSVRGDGERLRATLQLIDAASDRHQWSEEYDAEADDLLEVQSTVAGQVALRVARTLRPSVDKEVRRRIEKRPTESEAAWRAYQRGWYLWQNTGAPGERSTTLFREAVELDPDFALAWAALAEGWLASAHFGVPPHVAFPRADSAAVQALARDPELAEAHVALADTRFHYEWNWEAAERGFLRGLELNPSHSTGHWFYAGLLAALGRFDEAAERLESSRTLDPLSPLGDAFGAFVLYWAGRYDEAEASAWRALELNPNHFYALGALGFIQLERGELEEAVETFRRSVEISPKFRAGLALALARAGRTAEAREIADRLDAAAEDGYVAPYSRAFARVGLGDHDRALTLLEEATETRDAELIWIAVEPAFDPLRSDPRFQAILREMGLDAVGAGVADRIATAAL